MNNTKNHIKLYPSNWLYNAGVVGLIEVIGKCQSETNENSYITSLQSNIILKNEGTVEFDSNELKHKRKVNNFDIPEIAYQWLYQSWELFTKKEKDDFVQEAWGKLFYSYYRGFFDANTNRLYDNSKSSEALIKQFSNFTKEMFTYDKESNKCSFCNEKRNSKYKNVFTSEHSKFLGGTASSKGVPNAFWNCDPKKGEVICDLCSFTLLNMHFSLVQLSDRSQIFINAPSFKLMYYLNKFAREAFGSTDRNESRTKREILANSVIEYATKVQTTFGAWTGMNIEIISKRGDKIEFFSLPYETIQLISNRQIASLISAIGEFRVLNIVLDGKYSRLINDAYKLMRIGFKPYSERGKHEKDFLNEYFAIWRNRQQPLETAQKMLNLYALIEEKTKTNNYGRNKSKTAYA